jgi:hypothetical protein
VLCAVRMNVHFFSFPRQAAGEERSVHGRGGAVGAAGRRAARQVRRRLETGSKTHRTSWSHSLLVEALIIRSADCLCSVGRDPEQVRGDHGRHRCGARDVERRCRRIGSTFAVTFLSILPGKTF